MMPRPDYLGPYPDLYVGGQRLWKAFAGPQQVWPEGFAPMWVCYGTRGGSNPAYILYSEDGEDWARVDIDIPILAGFSYDLSQHSIAVDPSTNTFFVAEQSQKFWKSTDGQNWTSSTFPSNKRVSSFSYGNGVWIAGIGRGGATNYHGFARSTDAENWTESTLPLNAGVAGGPMDMNHYTPEARFLSSLQRDFRSTDEGLSWSNASPNLQEYCYASDGNGTIVRSSGSGPDFYRSTDGGASWTLVSSISGANSLFTTSLAYGNGVWVTTVLSNTSNVWKSTDDCSTWTAIQSSMYSPSLSIIPGYRVAYNHRDDEWVVAGRNSSTFEAVFWKSSDGTATWDGPFETSFAGNLWSLIHNSGLPDTKLP